MLLRHAKSAWPRDVADHARPLNARGRRDAAAVGRWLADSGLVPDLVLSSDAVRTTETWRLARTEMSAAPEAEALRKLYGAQPDDVVTLARQSPSSAHTLVVVGHEPTMSVTAYRLAGPGSNPDAINAMTTKFPTSGIAVLRLDGDWPQLGDDAAVLETFTVPRG